MSPLVSYRLTDSVATIAMDDGKVNVLSLPMLTALNAALDRAAEEAAVVVLTGREGVFSAGFDLRVLAARDADAVAMARAGFELAARVLSFPRPVVIACTGHAIAMGALLLLSGDYRIGAAGSYKLTTNEVAIGIPLPGVAIAIMRERLSPAGFTRAAILAEPFAPDSAVAAGFLDRVVDAADLPDAALATALALTALDMDAHAATKLRAREAALRGLRAATDADFAAIRPA